MGGGETGSPGEVRGSPRGCVGTMSRLGLCPKKLFYLLLCRLPDFQWVSSYLYQFFCWCNSKETSGGKAGPQREGRILVCTVATEILPLPPQTTPGSAHWTALPRRRMAEAQRAAVTHCKVSGRMLNGRGTVMSSAQNFQWWITRFAAIRLR